MQAILSGFNMAESGDLAAAEESYVGRWPGLAAPTGRLQPEGLGYAVCLGCKGQYAGRSGPS